MNEKEMFELIRESHLTISAIARRLNVTRETLYKWIYAKKNYDTILHALKELAENQSLPYIVSKIQGEIEKVTKLKEGDMIGNFQGTAKEVHYNNSVSELLVKEISESYKQQIELLKQIIKERDDEIERLKNLKRGKR